MKFPFFLLFSLAFALLLSSCNNATPNKTSDEPAQNKKAETLKLLAKNVISVKTFNQWKNDWENHGKEWMDSTMQVWKGSSHPILTAFNMPKIDLSEVLTEQADSTRFYLGLKAEAVGYEAKLMLVGVKADKNMLDASKGEYAYDLTHACPPYCGDN